MSTTNRMNSIINTDLLKELIRQLKETDYAKSSEEISHAIDELHKLETNLNKAKSKALEREIAEAERQRVEAEKNHIQEVTCMDLPMDWNNVFDEDTRTRGVHVDSVQML